MTGSAAEGAVPALRTDFQRVFVPDNGRYVNDHCLVRAADGIWHLFAIAQVAPEEGPTDPKKERSLLHATAPTLFGPWTEHPDVLEVDERLDEHVAWAPFVVQGSPGEYSMYYWTETRLSPLGLRQANSTDLFGWERVEKTCDESLRPRGGRDPSLLHVGDQWLLYSAYSPWGVVDRGQIVVSVNDDLSDPRGWSEHRTVIEDEELLSARRFLESPTVLERHGQFYLFLSRIGPEEPREYLRTLVFRSADPFHFDFTHPIAQFPAHAAEVVQDENGELHLTSSGWTDVIGEENRGLKLARLGWD